LTHTSGTGALVFAACARDIIPEVIGKPLSPRGLWKHTWDYLHNIGGAGVTTHIMSAFDISYWDLLGKSLNQPVVDLIGRVHQKVALYGSGINLHNSVDEVIEQVGRWRSKGYAMGKVKVGKPDIEEDVERIAKIREAVGTFPIAVDANQGWDFAQALRAIKKFKKYDLFWVEEPLPSDDISGHARLRQLIDTPIGIGENVYNVSQFNEYFRGGGVDFVQADIGRVGGITGYLNIATVANTYNLPMTPHFVLELSASLLATVPNARFAEVTDGGSFVELGILKSAGTEVDGFYYPSDSPGTGLVYNTEYLQAHRID
jgi:L-alanine-DL-glutamate epimerase-like enolase superfamily enzyme